MASSPGMLTQSPDAPLHLGADMKTSIAGFHQDEKSHWVADLDCGHSRHFRHNPPWQERAWVTTQQGRDRFLGSEVDCKKCDEDRKHS